ncbi:ATP-dependent DNA helicase [Elysia marginata]|uniref:ATP-dependent DNA helicase n=1 Tax=Elysia marginata TaxID=1093978 RepID=A0AAV4J271_9GAST|nr:ATP-dependent DNA helicase [Elysia marginata]
MISESNSDIICISETWLTGYGDDVITTELTPPGFKKISYPRLSGAEGGVCVINRDRIKLRSERVTDYSSFECLKIVAFDIAFIREKQLYKENVRGRIR